MALESLPPAETTSAGCYVRELGSRAVRRFEIESELRVALNEHEFHLVYQPKVDIAEMRVVGAEALARWTSRRFGNVPPKDFVPALEGSGLIVEFGAWVLRSVCRQIAVWDSAGLVCPAIALNASSRQLFDGDFVAGLQRELGAAGLAGDRLNVEITESALVDDMEGAIAVMNRVRALGVRFSIDDFGTGFSSLSYLRRMPVHTLKIDRSFVEHIGTQAEDRKLVQSIMSMAEALSLEVVAEGVEQAEQLAVLRAVGCRQVQGYLFGKPLPPDQFIRLLAGPLDYRV
jgi:EAL domain-containing protein (putative c-di-GMP-specific phosphodiesterase class I)